MERRDGQADPRGGQGAAHEHQRDQGGREGEGGMREGSKTSHELVHFAICVDPDKSVLIPITKLIIKSYQSDLI